MTQGTPMDHFVLTRFNIASPGREAPIRNSPGWLSRRFDLFETYCLPSMAEQIATEFQWLIYFDEATPEPFRERIEAARQIAAFEPIFVATFRASDAAPHVNARLSPAARRVVTTRLDNDDAVARDFLSRIQEEARQLPDATIINFTDGAALASGRLFAARDLSNPFASLVEDRGQIQTIWAAPHTELATQFPVHQVRADPVWLQVVHGENVTNRIKGKRLRSHDVLARFAVAGSSEIKQTSSRSILVDRLIAFPLRLLREAVISAAKAIISRP